MCALALACGLLFALTDAAFAQASAAASSKPKSLKIAHQFPGSSGDTGDFRDRLCRRFAAEVEKRTNGALKVEVFPDNQLFRSEAQFPAVQNGGVDFSLIPLAYAGQKIPEVNLTLMPALIESYAQAAKWKTEPIGRDLSDLLEKQGVKIITWIWQAGGIASTGRAVLVPEDVKGMKIRGAGKDMDLMLKAAGGTITSMSSSEVFPAMKDRVLDATVTSSTSLVSYKLYENSKNVTTARDHSFWFMFEPLIMSKSAFDALTPEQQKIVLEVGASLEPFALEQAQADDKTLAEVYGNAGVAVHDMNAAQFAKWRELSRASAWAEFEKSVKDGKGWLEKANAVK